jgi:hypothetical protein
LPELPLHFHLADYAAAADRYYAISQPFIFIEAIDAAIAADIADTYC